MYIASKSTSIHVCLGAHGMYFRLDACNFSNNEGPGSPSEFGAAVGVSLFTIFQQRVTAERHDIVNWYTN